VTYYDELIGDDDEGAANRDEAMARVERNADEGFLDSALDAYGTAALRYETFTSDQVWAILAEWNVPAPHEPRVMGPVASEAVKVGFIRMTDRTRPSVRPEAHKNPKRVYRSLRWGG